MIGVNTIILPNGLPKHTVNYRLLDQIIASATSIGANYWAACRAKSCVDFINKLKIVEKETDETMCWIEGYMKAGLFLKKKPGNFTKNLTKFC